MATYDLIIKGGEVVNHAGRGRADVAVTNGKIAAIGDLSQADAGEMIDATGLHVLPGVIDTQVHFREPGLEYKEDLASGGEAAVLGGVTAVFEMPNTNPSTTTPEAINDKLARAKGRMRCDHAFYAGATHENLETLGALERLPGCCGIKVFMGASTGSLLVADDEGIAGVLANISRRAAFHCEDEPRMRERKDLAREGDWTSHPEVRDVETAVRATTRLLTLAKAAGKRVHVLHVTTAEEVPLLAAAKDFASMEVTPQHLTLAAPEAYETLKGKAQMNPPIREARHREALWEAVRQGVVDVIGSDHAPHAAEEKDKPYPASPSGMPGVQTLVPVVLDHVNAGRLTLERFVDLTAHGAQRIFNIAGKGRMAVGWDGDFTLVDLKAQRTIEDSWIASKCGWTPFAGKTVTGWPVRTIIRGRTAMADDQLVGTPEGEPVRFMETLGAG
ncbi:MAG: dihydroorotase [Maricaulaceae bacterium]|jgi:dihydroorotase